MTEDKWRVCSDPRKMLDYHRMKTDKRRLRLLACACVRLALPPDPWTAGIVDVVERFADEQATRADFLAARKAVVKADPKAYKHAKLLGRYNGLTDDTMEGLTGAIESARRLYKKGGKVTECGLIRCVFPLRQVAFDPAWLTSTAVALARGIYEERAFDRMPILADALQDAGCDDAGILGHCRGGEPHARGCWVIDGLLRKKGHALIEMDQPRESPAMNAFDRVMAQPASLAARYALLAEWRTTGNPQVELLDKQLRGRPRRGFANEVRNLINAHGRTWAGRVADLVERFTFYRGLIGGVELSGEQFLQVGRELLALAPIQHVRLTKPFGSVEAITASPLLARLTTLNMYDLGDAFGDRGATALAQNPHAANLVNLGLSGNAIGRAGVEALAASPHLRGLRYVELSGNPANATPKVEESWYDSSCMMPTYFEFVIPPLMTELRAKFGPRPWLEDPPVDPNDWIWYVEEDELALVRDYPHAALLDELEASAREVDELAASDPDGATTWAKRQRLLIELDVAGVLTGQPEIGALVTKHATLRGYHDACVAMTTYHNSPARLRLTRETFRAKPSAGYVSLDWFRTPSGYVPEGVPADDWLALCEINLRDPMPEGKTGTRFVRLEGHMHVLYYRVEAGPEPKLWRAEPA